MTPHKFLQSAHMQRVFHGPARRTPYLSSSLGDYLKKYWAIVFTVGAMPVETGHMRHYVAWYCTRLKVVELDHHIYADELRQAIVARAGTAVLPILFVNQRLVGTLSDVKRLEEGRLLKDVLQFGFEWKTGGDAGRGAPAHRALPSAYEDIELFRGRYRGPPVARPVVQLPTLHPFHKVNTD